ncbi:MAG: hypothetical protein COA47_06980 [Robiginitomaculum sp.]|nr:MAG: hypothetical protein COA47_06980 [Robiginitomaculum sp.]
MVRFLKYLLMIPLALLYAGQAITQTTTSAGDTLVEDDLIVTGQEFTGFADLSSSTTITPATPKQDSAPAQATSLALPATGLRSNTDFFASAPARIAQPIQNREINSRHFLVQQAGHWDNFQRDVTNWGRRNFQSADELEYALIDFARYDGARMASGWMAANSLFALQVPEFAAGLQNWKKIYGSKALLAQLHSNPAYVLLFPGAEQARQALLDKASQDAKRLAQIGKKFKAQAYSLQKQSWANRKQLGKASRLLAIKNAPYSPKVLRVSALDALIAPVLAQMQPRQTYLVQTPNPLEMSLGTQPEPIAMIQPTTPPKVAPGRDQTLVHTLSLAAILMLGESDDHQDFRNWSKDQTLKECVDWSRLHLNQCVAAGHFAFESSFCIAEHQLVDAGECVGSLVAHSNIQ